MLHQGSWQDYFEEIGEWDALISDPPYSSRTHGKQLHGRRKTGGDNWCSSRGIGYDSLGEEQVREICALLVPRTRGWFCVQTDSELYPAWRDALTALGRYVFAPIPCVRHGMSVRLAGDGPSSWTVWLVVSRPRCHPYSKWGTLPGAYVGSPFDTGETASTTRGDSTVVGSKPVWMMRAIIRDYSRPGGLIFDPFAGGGTTLVAATIEGRDAVGCEVSETTYRAARARCEKPFTPSMF